MADALFRLMAKTGAVTPQVEQLNDVIGRSGALQVLNCPFDVIPLPHPCGASTWLRTEPGRSLLQAGLQLISRHSTWQTLPRCGKVSLACRVRMH